MVIKVTLDEATNLANHNNSLSWDGWTLIYSKPNKMGWARSDGAYNRQEQQWYVEKRFVVQDDGWYHIPKNIYNGLQH